MTQPIAIQPKPVKKPEHTTSYQDKCEGCDIQRVGNPYTACACWSKCKTCDKSTITSHRELYHIQNVSMGKCTCPKTTA
ncbi:uncharacterized protein N7473_005415 [Penicillium subrubescens]|uniref:Uncharacterized protein n=1 Tax=Penicillium subrubescens TaxID=1316194 RepID=A0A1Q5ULV0_9EURO|nr:uncharacterized protein N7473_005415 [Penicillium subrubescens]KAJ5896016.1 hypothetical protein N7473_005415 [Penicillium subrubescens]OKP13440.1 hypothetical protein PENSUB_631 [Penicillium subrubescens]